MVSVWKVKSGGQMKSLTPFSVEPKQPVSAITAINSDEIWIGTAHGHILKYSSFTRELLKCEELQTVSSRDAQRKLSINAVVSITRQMEQRPKASLWAATSNPEQPFACWTLEAKSTSEASDDASFEEDVPDTDTTNALNVGITQGGEVDAWDTPIMSRHNESLTIGSNSSIGSIQFDPKNPWDSLETRNDPTDRIVAGSIDSTHGIVSSGSENDYFDFTNHYLQE
mmetsp:Transcript_7022/g.10725  ORF Transcript_7022/g.10725 Transcript_7022/m.10725 type:complete len:226 (-) Transcript_7022:50-727(-)